MVYNETIPLLVGVGVGAHSSMNSEPSTVKSGRFSSVRVQEVPDMDPVEDAPSTLAHQTISRPEQNALQLQGKADQSALTT